MAIKERGKGFRKQNTPSSAWIFFCFPRYFCPASLFLLLLDPPPPFSSSPVSLTLSTNHHHLPLFNKNQIPSTSPSHFFLSLLDLSPSPPFCVKEIHHFCVSISTEGWAGPHHGCWSSSTSPAPPTLLHSEQHSSPLFSVQTVMASPATPFFPTVIFIDTSSS